MRIQDSPVLRDMTTLRLGGKVIALIEVDNILDLDKLPQEVKNIGGSPVSFGRGSNILADDADLPLTLIRSSCHNEPEIIHVAKDRVLVRVEAGLSLQRLLRWAEVNGLSGLEGLAGIPGQVGGSVAMNAGSYEVEIGRKISSMRVFSPQTGLRILVLGAFEPEYRGMSFPGLGRECSWSLIWDVDLALRPSSRKEVSSIMSQNLSKKRSTQPLSKASAGCVFMNPDEISAGKLLEDAGFKGKGIGDMAFSDLHANFLVNEGQGTYAQAMELISLAEEAVKERFGINLKREVKIWPSR